MKSLSVNGMHDPKVLNMIIDDFEKNVPLEVTARKLSKYGYISSPRSKSSLTASQLCNFRKKLGLRKKTKYKKPNYKGKNWRAFSKDSHSQVGKIVLKNTTDKALNKTNEFKKDQILSKDTLNGSSGKIEDMICAVLLDTKNRPSVNKFAQKCWDRYHEGTLTGAQLQGLVNCYKVSASR